MKKMICFSMAFLFALSMVSIVFGAQTPKVSAQGAVVMDQKTGRVLFGKNETEPMAMASTTKIMSAIVALEEGKLNDTVVASKRASQAAEVKMHLSVGEEHTMEALLYAMLLQSYNDAAVAVAEHIGGSVEEFCEKMTQKARELGCTDTVFKTPNGLDLEDHHSTAYDMALISRYALNNEKFREIINTPTINITSLEGKKNYCLVNKNRLLREYEGALGIKTGFTGKAGQCFAGAAKRGDMTLVSVVLASGWGAKGKEQKWKDTKVLLDYGFQNYNYTDIIKQGERSGNIPIIYSKTKEIPLVFQSDYMLPLNEEERAAVDVVLNVSPYLEAPIQKGALAGKAEIFIGGNKEGEVAIITADAASRNDLEQSAKKLFKGWFECGEALLKRINF